ncbi:MAG: hypothetical protein ACE5LB_06205 [Acidiferrobacterales bacterium]
MAAGALFILSQRGLLGWRPGAIGTGRVLAGLFGDSALPGSVWEALWLGLVAALLLGAVFAFAVGLLALFNRAGRRRLSAFANRWISTQQGSQALDTPRYKLDHLMHPRRQLWGAVITVLATYTAAVLVTFWRLR